MLQYEKRCIVNNHLVEVSLDENYKPISPSRSGAYNEIRFFGNNLNSSYRKPFITDEYYQQCNSMEDEVANIISEYGIDVHKYEVYVMHSYSHGGYSLRCAAVGDSLSCRFDSGIAGYIFVPKKFAKWSVGVNKKPEAMQDKSYAEILATWFCEDWTYYYNPDDKYIYRLYEAEDDQITFCTGFDSVEEAFADGISEASNRKLIKLA